MLAGAALLMIVRVADAAEVIHIVIIREARDGVGGVVVIHAAIGAVDDGDVWRNTAVDVLPVLVHQPSAAGGHLVAEAFGGAIDTHGTAATAGRFTSQEQAGLLGEGGE